MKTTVISPNLDDQLADLAAEHNLSDEQSAALKDNLLASMSNHMKFARVVTIRGYEFGYEFLKDMRSLWGDDKLVDHVSIVIGEVVPLEEVLEAVALCEASYD